MNPHRKVMMVLFAVVCFAACMSVFAEPDVEIPVRCNGEVCLVPQGALKALFEAHNQHVEEIARLTELTKGCVKLKKDRDA